jgi:hypothetical protein
MPWFHLFVGVTPAISLYYLAIIQATNTPSVHFISRWPHSKICSILRFLKIPLPFITLIYRSRSHHPNVRLFIDLTLKRLQGCSSGCCPGMSTDVVTAVMKTFSPFPHKKKKILLIKLPPNSRPLLEHLPEIE